MSNVGCVLYKKGDDLGTLYAKWVHSSLGNGTGKATGGPAVGFVGCYHIRYFDDKGNEVAERMLDIRKNSDYYELPWIINGKIGDRGIGMEVEEGFVAGWC